MKALVLFSGGLDSILAIKLLQKQGIKVVAYHFTSPVLTENINAIKKTADELKVRLIVEEADYNYFKMLRNPKHGYGSAINPCIDCRIFVLKRAKKVAKKIGAKFIATGEVLGERPMTQVKRSLELIETESGLKNRLLRPLSAKLLPETAAESKGWVCREGLLDIKGRNRRIQLSLAKKYNLKDYPTPAGGCLLTQKEFADRLKDLFKHKKTTNSEDIYLLRFGRHFRYKNSKIIVGRNEKDNNQLLKFKKKTDIILEVPDFGSPITILQGKELEFAAKLTARYSDSENNKILVKYGKQKPIKSLFVSPATQKQVDTYMITPK